MEAGNFAKYFDHTLLRADATHADFRSFCADCARYGFAMAAVNPEPVRLCKELLDGSGVRVGAAIGFPLGQNTVDTKVFETEKAIEDGADEIDYVINIGRLKSGDRAYIKDEMHLIVQLCRQAHVTSKVIFENCYLDDEERRTLCKIALDVQPDYIKTSTGFGKGGATFEDIALMKEMVGERIKIKAAGGIRTLQDAKKMIELGASRIGSTASVQIVEAFLALKK